MPVEKESQEVLSFLLDNDVVTPTRVMEGHVDSALFFQASMRDVSEEASLLYKNMLVWIDDVLIYAKTYEEYMDVLEKFLSKMEEKNLKLNPQKCELFQRQVKWCGRLIDGHGVKQDPEWIKALNELPYPTNAGELQQFLCATNWIRDSLPYYAIVVAPLQARMNKELEGKGRKKRIAVGITLELTDGEKHQWEEVRNLLKKSVELAHPNEDGTTCLFTDASNDGWSIVFTQVLNYKGDIPIQEQHHEIVLCQSGLFKGAQLKWSVIEKEAYPIAKACKDLNYLLMGKNEFKLFCDHKNLVHVFAPSQEWKAHIRGKLLRWAAIISEYRYEIEHIDGVNNVWADMMSRWGHPKPKDCSARQQPKAHNELNTEQSRPKVAAYKKRKIRKRKQMAALAKSQQKLRPLDDEGFIWPSFDEIGM
ncbi:hypothetical protein LEN26_020136, partial [Aphanomyces euteiches]